MVRGKSQGTPSSSAQDKPKREAILDLSKYMNEYIRVKFTGGREGATQHQQSFLSLGPWILTRCNPVI